MFSQIAMLTDDDAVNYVTAFMAAFNTAADERGINLREDHDARDLSLDIMIDEAAQVIGAHNWTLRGSTLYVSRAVMVGDEDFEAVIDQMLREHEEENS